MNDEPIGEKSNDAGGGTRTPTPLRAPDFESFQGIRNGVGLAWSDVATRNYGELPYDAQRNQSTQARAQFGHTASRRSCVDGQLVLAAHAAARARRGLAPRAFLSGESTAVLLASVGIATALTVGILDHTSQDDRARAAATEAREELGTCQADTARERAVGDIALGLLRDCTDLLTEPACTCMAEEPQR